jgi:isopentenyl diphosphate isomerase/L-lactate dehydrogenase-like FMN-dependent dehydrogenase
MEDMPGTARVLPHISKEVGDKIIVLVDGGARSGRDIFKFLCLGAKGVLTGRPSAIAAVGGGALAVRSLFETYRMQIQETMNLTGVEKIASCSENYLSRVQASASEIEKQTD